MSLRSTEKLLTGQRDLHVIAIWSCDIGQGISCIDSCQLNITWRSNIKVNLSFSSMNITGVAAMLRDVHTYARTYEVRAMPLAMMTVTNEVHDSPISFL